MAAQFGNHNIPHRLSYEWGVDLRGCLLFFRKNSRRGLCDNNRFLEKKTDDKEETTQEEEVEVEAPYTLVPVEIDGVEFMIPQEVADYIHTLEDGLSSAEEISENFRKEIAQMKERIPSTNPVTTVVKQSQEDVVEKPSFGALIGALNKKF